MITKDYVITAPLGLHARPATTLIRLAKNYKSAISLKKGEKTHQAEQYVKYPLFKCKRWRNRLGIH
jgi:phosphotransferase system HPr (HPr) family protein